MIPQHNNDQWTTIIKPRSGWFDLKIGELFHYRDLIILFVKRDFIAIYKQTILGPVWFFIQPIFSTLAFTLIFGNVAKIPTGGVPHVLFYLSGIVCWNYFSNCLSKTSETFITNSYIFGKVYFPRLTVPISIVITNLITFFIQLSLLIAILLYYYYSQSDIQPNMTIFFLPLLIIQIATLGLGLGIIISSLTTKYRDFNYLLGFGIQLWMYGTPIVYPLSEIPEKWKLLFILNPMTAIVETFRYSFVGKGGVNWMYHAISVFITLSLLIIGLLLFSRVEKNFMDTV
jgi:lipopolysaccharide transport system permease protein